MLLLIIGLAIIGFDIIADRLNIGDDPGLGPAQMFVAIIGLFTCLIALSLRSKNIRHSNIAIFSLFAVFITTDFFMTPETETALGSFTMNTRHPSLYYHHDLPENSISVVDRNGVKYTMITNSLRFRDSRNRTVELDNNKNRILIIGDSFTEGYGESDYDLTFSRIFSSKLDNEKYEVLDAGVVSYSPKLYYLKVKYLIEIKHLRFNELFVFIDISDIQDEIVYEKFRPITRIEEWAIATRQRSYWLSTIRSLICKKQKSISVDNNGPDSSFWGGKYYQTRSLWATDESIYKKWGRKGLLLANKNMDLLYQLCKKHKIKMTIAVYPWPHQIAKHDLNSTQIKFWKAFAAKRSIGLINFFPYFINGQKAEEIINKYYISGDIHWNDAGHRLIADVLYEHYKNMNNSKN